MSDDVKVSRSYRDLGAEEPPRALDEAILAAARREAGAGPASLSAPSIRSGRQRWYAPLATAAVLVLAVAVTLQMQVERPGIESPGQQAAPLRADQAAAGPSSPAAETELNLKVEAQLKSARTQVAKDRAVTRRKDAGELASAAPAAQAAPRAQNRADTPERELEGIAQLRGQGRHDEADKALAEFRKRYPEYRIPEAMRERLERR